MDYSVKTKVMKGKILKKLSVPQRDSGFDLTSPY